MMSKPRKYDGKVLFKAYCSWGAAASNTRLMEFAYSEFGAKSQMGPHYSMWNWAFRNPEESYLYWKEWYFDKYPDLKQPTFEDYLLVLKERGMQAQTVGGSLREVERFCAKYGLEMEYRIKPDDVIQVTRPDHALFQRLLVVDRIDGQRVEAFALNADGSRSNHQLTVREFGVVGKAIV